MARQAIFLSDEKPRDLERYPTCSKDGHGQISTTSHVRESRSPIRVFVKWALICTLTVLAITFVLETFEPQRSKVLKPGSHHRYYGEIPKICPDTKHRKTLSFDFINPKELAFSQESHDVNRRGSWHDAVRTVGKVEFLKQDSLANIRITLDIRSSDPQLTSAESLSLIKSGSALKVKTPKWTSREVPSGSEPPCIYVAATVSIPPGTTLENLRVDTETLSVIFSPGLDYAITNCTEINAHSSSLSLSANEPPSININPRETNIHVTSGSVTGSYPLYDTLDISTVSGSIDVDVEPKDADDDNVQPAILRLSSQSGSIRALTSIASVPARDYQATIESVNGGIDATLLHGSRTLLRSRSGHVRADLHPYGHNNSRTDIKTHCQSGSTDITVHSSLSHPTDPIKKLYSEHHGFSGSLSLWYPAQWEGTVKGNTMSGSIDLDWDALKIVKDEKKGWVGRTVEAVRGSGESQLIFSEQSGGINLGGDGEAGALAGRKR